MKTNIKFLTQLSVMVLLAASIRGVQTVGASSYGLSRMTLKHKEFKGIGFNQGYTTLGMFISGQSNEFPFGALIDVRAHLFNDFSYAANAGLGFRLGDEDQTYSFGINGYYDYRWKECLESHQLAAGIEVLTRHVDFRLNGYKPLVGKYYDEPLTFSRFKDHQILLTQYVTYALPMVDAEVGFSLPDPFDQVGLYLGVAGYYLFKQKGYKNSSGDVPGGKIRLQASPSPYLSFSGEYSYDKLFKGRGNGTIAINIPLGRVCHDKILRKNQIPWALVKGQDIVRQEIIPFYRGSHESTLTHNNGSDLRVIFVDNRADSLGAGTYEKPYKSLLEAQKNSKEGDFVYVDYGDGSSFGYDQGFVFKKNQALIGSGRDINLSGIIIPAKTPNRNPLVTSSTGSTITANQVTNIRLEGFKILGNGYEALSMSNSSGFITQNVFESVGCKDVVTIDHIIGNSCFYKNEIKGNPTRSLVYFSSPKPHKEGFHNWEENIFIAESQSYGVFFENNFDEVNFKKNIFMGSDPSLSAIKILAKSQDTTLSRFLFEQNRVLTGYAVGAEIQIDSNAYIQCEYKGNYFVSDTLALGVIYENSSEASDLIFDGNYIKSSGEGLIIDNKAIETRISILNNEFFACSDSPCLTLLQKGEGQLHINDNYFVYPNYVKIVKKGVLIKASKECSKLEVEMAGNEFSARSLGRDIEIDLKELENRISEINYKIVIHKNNYSQDLKPVKIDHIADKLYFILDASNEELDQIEVSSSKE